MKVISTNFYRENIGQDGKYTSLNFSTWIAFNFPIAAINLTISWIYLGLIYIGCPKWQQLRNKNKAAAHLSSNSYNKDISSQSQIITKEQNVKKQLETKLAKLGPITFHELCISFLFIIVISLWFTRDPQIFPGWASLFDKSHVRVGDSTIAFAIVLLMFIIPKQIIIGSTSNLEVVDDFDDKGSHYCMIWLSRYIYDNDKRPYEILLL